MFVKKIKNLIIKNRENNFSFLKICFILAIAKILLLTIFFAIILPQSPTLQKKINLIHARFISNNSTMQWINYVVVWYDATSDEAFLTNEAQDGKKISLWRSSKIRYKDKINMLQNNDNNQPIFVKNGISNLPSIKFDGLDDYLLSENFQNNILQYKSASFFIVLESQNIDINRKQSLFYHDANCDKNFEISYQKNDFIVNFDIDKMPTKISTQCQMNNYKLTSSQSLSKNTKSVIGIIIKRDDFSDYKIYYLDLFHNGNLEDSYSIKVANDNKNNLGQNDSEIFRHFYLGGIKKIAQQNSSFNFKGLIGEVIIFNRSLNNYDKKELENYLHKKWKIKKYE